MARNKMNNTKKKIEKVIKFNDFTLGSEVDLFEKNIGKKSIIYCDKGSLEITDTWHGSDKIIKVVNGKRNIIKKKMTNNIYSYQIENISKSILENKNQTFFPGFNINDTLLNTEILEKWSNV